MRITYSQRLLVAICGLHFTNRLNAFFCCLVSLHKEKAKHTCISKNSLGYVYSRIKKKLIFKHVFQL